MLLMMRELALGFFLLRKNNLFYFILFHFLFLLFLLVHLGEEKRFYCWRELG